MSADKLLLHFIRQGMTAQEAADKALVRTGHQCRSCGSQEVETTGPYTLTSVYCPRCGDQYDLDEIE